MVRKARIALIIVGVIALTLLAVFAWTRENPYRAALRLSNWWETREYYATAIAELENQVVQSPRDPALRIDLARILLESLKPKQAFEAACEAYRLEPDSPEQWSELAGVLVLLHQGGGWAVDDEELRPYMIGCAEHLLPAARRDPGEREAIPEGEAYERVGFLLNAGQCYLLAGDRATGSVIFGEAMDLADRLEQKSAQLWVGIAVVLTHLQRRGGWPADDAEFRPYTIGCAERLVAAARRDPGEDGAVPEDQAADRVLCLIVAGQCYVSAGDRKTASAIFDEALDLADRLTIDAAEPTRRTAASWAGAIRGQRDAWLDGD
jgi:tetratricopeptide (TPR) repeat protein